MHKKKDPVFESVRQRAQKSCDRCKRKKRACKRYDENGVQKFDESYPCQNCISSNSECTVFIPRKKRIFFKVSDTELQQLKSLNLLIKATFPEYDPNNLDHLKKIANSMNISIPELEDYTDNNDSNNDSANETTSIITNQTTKVKLENSSVPDSNYINQKIGLVGSQRIFNVLLELEAAENGNPYSTNTQTNTHILPITTKSSRHLQSSIILTKIPIQECNMYMEVFFRDFHQSYFIFHEPVFRKRHEEFLDYIRRNELSSISATFTNEETCSIYMVWIIGRSCHLRNVLQLDNSREVINLVNEPIIDEYVNVVRISLSNCFFSSSRHSVRVLYLMGLHSMIKSNTEAAWYFWVNACLKCCGLGFQTASVVARYSIIEQEEIKIIWWSCFKIHLNNSAIIGRLPVITLSDVDVELPLLESKSKAFKNAYTYSIRLFKIMYLILKNREDLLKAKELWAQENMISLIKIIGKLKSWKAEMVQTLGSYLQPEGRYIIKLYLQYYYSSISLITPYLVSYSLQNLALKENINSIVTVLSYGIESAVEVIDVILFSVSSGNFNGVLHYDLFYAYNSLMVLLLYYSIIKTSRGKNPLEAKIESELQIDKSKIMQCIYQIRNVNKYHGHKTIGLNKFTVNINILLDCFKLNNDNYQKDVVNIGEVPLINVAKLPQTPQESCRRPSNESLKDLLAELPALPSPMLKSVYIEDDTVDVDEGFYNFIKFISKENQDQNKPFNDQVILEWNTNNEND